MKGLREWWGRLSLRARLAGAFALLAAASLVFLLAIIARTLGMESLLRGKILPTAIFTLTMFFIGGWLVAGWCLSAISQLGARINEKPPGPIPSELEGLASLLRHEAQRRDSLLNELRRFTADASHELRTPLTALHTVGEVALRDENARNESLRDAIGSMLEEAQRMNSLVERLLCLARVESEGLPAQIRHLNVYEQLLEWVDSVIVLAEERGVTLELDCPRELQLDADAELLGQAAVNLIHNAIRYSHPGGVVRIVASVENSMIVIAVSDQGPGIAPEHHARLFERFYRVDAARSRQHGGFGLGLCIAHTAITRLNGRLTVASTLGLGSSFRIHLPATSPSSLSKNSGTGG